MNTSYRRSLVTSCKSRFKPNKEIKIMKDELEIASQQTYLTII
jgi:hypothetical protein